NIRRDIVPQKNANRLAGQQYRVMTRNGLIKILAPLLTLTILLGATELAARIYQYSRNRTFNDALLGVNYRDYFFLGPSFKPNSGGSWQGIPDLQINRFGFRGEDFSIEKPADEFRI